MKEGLALLVFGEDMEFLPFSYSAFSFLHKPPENLINEKGETKNYNGASVMNDICGKRIAPWEIRVLPGLMNKKADMVSVSPFYFFHPICLINVKTKIMDNKEKSIVEKLMDEIVPDVNNDFELGCKFLIKSINRQLENQYTVSINYHIKSNLWDIPWISNYDSQYGGELCRLPKDLFNEVIIGFFKKGYSVIQNNSDTEITVVIYKAADKTYCEKNKIKL